MITPLLAGALGTVALNTSTILKALQIGGGLVDGLKILDGLTGRNFANLNSVIENSRPELPEPEMQQSNHNQVKT
jgi:hypothetical protein